MLKKYLNIILKRNFDITVNKLSVKDTSIISETEYIYEYVAIVWFPVKLIKRNSSRWLSKGIVSVARVTCVR